MTQLPPPHHHRHTVHPRAKRLRPKTYSVAVYLVVTIVILQVLMLISVFYLRAMVIPIKVISPKPKNVAGATQTAPAPQQVGPPAPKPDVLMPTLRPLAMSPDGPRLSVPSPSDDLEQITTLNAEAELFLKQHAPESAVVTLTKAEDIDPRHPTTLKNLAETYNLLDDLPRSKIYWQRLVDLGQSVGTIYGVAVDHVTLLNSKDAGPLQDHSTYPRLIYIDSVEKSPVDTASGRAQFHLRATLERKGSKMPQFDQKKLQPYVIFYQQMPDGSLVPDLDQHRGSFDDTFLFWGNKTSEPFGVDYFMPNTGTMGSNNTPMGRYYGFVIGIYYDKILQDVRSEPSDLATRIPLPQEIE